MKAFRPPPPHYYVQHRIHLQTAREVVFFCWSVPSYLRLFDKSSHDQQHGSSLNSNSKLTAGTFTPHPQAVGLTISRKSTFSIGTERRLRSHNERPSCQKRGFPPLLPCWTDFFPTRNLWRIAKLSATDKQTKERHFQAKIDNIGQYWPPYQNVLPVWSTSVGHNARVSLALIGQIWE